MDSLKTYHETTTRIPNKFHTRQTKTDQPITVDSAIRNKAVLIPGMTYMVKSNHKNIQFLQVV